MGLGLDIGIKTIKFIELSKDKDRWNLKASGVVGYKGKPPEDVKDDKELTPLAEAIKKLHKEAKIASKDVAITLPEQHVFTRSIKFPLLTDAEIASAVKWEAEQYIPIPINEAVVQHQIIERREDVTPGEAVVLLVASPKLLVEKYIKAVETAGLNVVIIETELLALVRSLAPIDQTVLLADFGARSTDIAVARNGLLTFSRSIPTAGEAFTRAIAQSLGIDLAQAEEYKRTYGLSPDKLEGRIYRAMEPIFRMVADEMKKAIHFYQSEEKGDSPRSAILAGGSSAMPDISPTLTKMLGIEVLVGNPFEKVNIDPQAVKSMSSYATYYAISTGLAMREE